MACAAIIVASGKSRRMGFDKLAAELRGVPVLRRSVEAFMACPGISRVVIVCPEDRFDALLGGDFAKPLTRVDGGAERQDSVQAGLDALSPEEDLVAVHDGARPLVRVGMIQSCLAAAEEHRAASLARPATETLKRADAHDFSRESVDRTRLWFTETPQIFDSALLQKGYRKVREQGDTVTDEVSVMEAIGVPTKLVSSGGPNLKITHPADITLAAALLD